MTNDSRVPRQEFDASVFGKLGGGEPARIRKLAQSFLAALETSLGELGAALAEQRPDEARRVAHKIKSSARWVGAEGLGALAETMEHWPAGARELDELNSQFDAIRKAADALRGHITAALAVLPTG